MTTLVQVSPDGVLVQGGWWPLVAWAVRASDGRLVAQVRDWRGGQGDKPPTGFIRADGSPTDDVDDAWAFPPQWVSVVGARGDARGDGAGRMHIASGTAAGEIAATWTDVADGFEADNGDPGDTGAKLRLPANPDADQIGWLLVAERDGTPRTSALAWGEFTGQTGATLPLSAPGEALTVRYRTPLDGEPDYFEIACRQGPLGEDVVLSIYKLTTGVAGAQPSALADLRADVARNARAIDELRRGRPAAGGVATPTQITGFELSGRTLTLDWTRNGRASSLSVVLPQTHAFELVADATELAAASTDETLLATAAIAGTAFAAGDVLAHDGAAWVRVINLGATSHVVAADSVTRAMLAPNLRAVLDGILDRAAVDSEIAAEVEPFGLRASNARIGEGKLPPKVDDFADALSGTGGYNDEGDNARFDAWIGEVLSSVAHPANIEAETYIRQQSWPYGTNLWVRVRVPEAITQDRLRLAQGSDEGGDWHVYPSAEWIHIATDGGYRYYTVSVPTVTADAIFRVQHYDSMELDAPKVGLEEWCELYVGDPANVPARLTIPANRTVAEVNPRSVTPAEVAAGEERGYRTYSPHDVETQILRHVGLAVLNDRALTGLAVVNNAHDVRQPLVDLSVAFDLDDAANQSGRIDVEVVLGIPSATRHSTSIGFDQSGATAALELRRTDFVALSRLRALAAYANNALNGVRILSAPVFREADQLGVLGIYLGKNANGILKPFYDYVGGTVPTAGAQNWNFTVDMAVWRLV